MVSADLISVTWTGAAGTPAEGSHTSLPVPVGTVGIKEIVIPNTVVAFNLGKPVTVRYTVIRDGTPVSSATLILAVWPLSASALTAPRILQGANGGEGPELDVSALTSNATVRQVSWPLIALGQYVWLRLTGTLANGVEYHKVLWQPPSGQTSSSWITNGYFDVAVLLSDLKELKDGSMLTVEFKAALGRSQSEAEAVVFPIRTYTVKVRPELILDPTPMVLNGSNISLAGTGINYTHTGTDPLNTTGKRTPSGGRPPYTYTSSDPMIASVDSAGLVRSEGNGTATITVTDQNETTATFQVMASNVTRCLYNPTLMNYPEYKQWANATTGRTLTSPAEVSAIAARLGSKYRVPQNIQREYIYTDPFFSEEHIPGGGRWSQYINLQNSVFSYIPPGYVTAAPSLRLCTGFAFVFPR
ncbi:Ig-like domain-containing protein [Pseudomonas sp. 210_17 TE3656]